MPPIDIEPHNRRDVGVSAEMRCTISVRSDALASVFFTEFFLCVFLSGLMRCWKMRLRDQFRECNPGQNQERSGGWTQAEPLAEKDEGRDPREDRLQCHDQRGMRGGQDRLCPALNGERSRRRQHRRDSQSNAQP